MDPVTLVVVLAVVTEAHSGLPGAWWQALASGALVALMGGTIHLLVRTGRILERLDNVVDRQNRLDARLDQSVIVRAPPREGGRRR